MSDINSEGVETAPIQPLSEPVTLGNMLSCLYVVPNPCWVSNVVNEILIKHGFPVGPSAYVPEKQPVSLAAPARRGLFSHWEFFSQMLRNFMDGLERGVLAGSFRTVSQMVTAAIPLDTVASLWYAVRYRVIGIDDGGGLLFNRTTSLNNSESEGVYDPLLERQCLGLAATERCKRHNALWRHTCVVSSGCVPIDSNTRKGTFQSCVALAGREVKFLACQRVCLWCQMWSTWCAQHP
eukprot:GHVR01171219.1.p2 GENE.GHVR01171219.1~~GHVR01171219.1.p2  ORF type:complete len:237 (-),score=11.86 GHVR01171219.1:1816-2526(-)